jgi:hypothetical protein
MNLSEESAVLSSWKDIAKYMGKGVRTVQRWEHHLGLPVRRPNGASHKSAVLLERSDLDAWLSTRFSARATARDLAANGTETSDSARSTLREGIQTARALRNANRELTQKIYESLRQLAERCDQLSSHAQEVPWSLPAPIAQGTASPLATQTDRLNRLTSA